MTANTTPEPERPMETWAFAGERVGSDGKSRVHQWIDPTGHVLNFNAGKSLYFVGGRYRVPVTRHEDGGITMHGAAFDYVDRVDSEDSQLIVWQAADTAAKARQAGRRRAARDAVAGDPLNDALNVLRRAANAMRTTADRDAFVAHVIQEMMMGRIQGR